MDSLSTDLLFHIFSYLPARCLMKCREVCSYWKEVIDSILKSDIQWRSSCKREYPNIYKMAWYKSKQSLLWYHLYRSLSLWSRISHARETRKELGSNLNISHEIYNFCVCQNGEVGVLKRSGIFYYDIETLEPSLRQPISGSYRNYSENDHATVILGNYLKLYIIRKVVRDHSVLPNVTINDVSSFLLADRQIYYMNRNNEICLCELTNDSLDSKVIAKPEADVLTIGYKDGNLYILTTKQEIYTFNGIKLVLAQCLGTGSNLIRDLLKYNLLETLDWGVVRIWMHLLHEYITEYPRYKFADAIIRMYGDIMFVGTHTGKMYIYENVYADDFNLLNAKAVKEYDFWDSSDNEVHVNHAIRHIDVVETEVGHTVLVAVAKKIVVINLIHDLIQYTPEEILP